VSRERVKRVAISCTFLHTTPQQGILRQQIGVALATATCLLAATTLYLANARILHRAQRNTQHRSSKARAAAELSFIHFSDGRRKGRSPTSFSSPPNAASKRPSSSKFIENVRSISDRVARGAARSDYQVRVAALRDQSKVFLQKTISKRNRSPHSLASFISQLDCLRRPSARNLRRIGHPSG
jgi:hypothetical protein